MPEDLSIVGIDNSELARLCPVPLTSVENPVEELGKSVAEKILGGILRKEEMEAEEFRSGACDTQLCAGNP